MRRYVSVVHKRVNVARAASQRHRVHRRPCARHIVVERLSAGIEIGERSELFTTAHVRLEQLRVAPAITRLSTVATVFTPTNAIPDGTAPACHSLDAHSAPPIE